MDIPTIPRGVPSKEKYAFFARRQISRADRRENLQGDRALSHVWVSPLLVTISLGVSKWGGVKNDTFCTIYLRRIVVAVL